MLVNVPFITMNDLADLLLLFPLFLPSARSEIKPLTYVRGYDTVLIGQGYRTPCGVVINEYRAMVE
jgi:hypothetical protein